MKERDWKLSQEAMILTDSSTENLDPFFFVFFVVNPNQWDDCEME